VKLVAWFASIVCMNGQIESKPYRDDLSYLQANAHKARLEQSLNDRLSCARMDSFLKAAARLVWQRTDPDQRAEYRLFTTAMPRSPDATYDIVDTRIFYPFPKPCFLNGLGGFRFNRRDQ